MRPNTPPNASPSHSNPPRGAESKSRVLRLGLARGGRVVAEKLVPAGQPVTVGTSRRCTLVLEGYELPQKRTLFHPNRDGSYAVCLGADLTGKLSWQGAVAGLDVLMAKAQGSGRIKRLTLSHEDRGKITLGEFTVLFQFVPPPLVMIGSDMDFRPKLLDTDDPIFYGFLSVFGTLAAAFMVVVYTTPVQQEMDVGDMMARMEPLVFQAPPETPPPLPPIEQPDEPAPDEVDINAEPVPVAPSEVEAEPQPSEGPSSEVERERRQAEAVANSPLMQALMLATRGANNNGDRVSNPFGEHDVIGQDLDRVLQGVNGIEVATNDGLTVRDNQRRKDADIGDLNRAEEGSAEVDDGAVGQGPTGSITLRPEDEYIEMDEPQAIRDIVKSKSGQVRFCYESELNYDPGLSGRVEIGWEVGRGRVLSAWVEDNSTGNDALAECIRSKVRTWSFPKEARGQVIFPFILSSSGG